MPPPRRLSCCHPVSVQSPPSLIASIITNTRNLPSQSGCNLRTHQRLSPLAATSSNLFAFHRHCRNYGPCLRRDAISRGTGSSLGRHRDSQATVSIVPASVPRHIFSADFYTSPRVPRGVMRYFPGDGHDCVSLLHAFLSHFPNYDALVSDHASLQSADSRTVSPGISVSEVSRSLQRAFSSSSTSASPVLTPHTLHVLSGLLWPTAQPVATVINRVLVELDYAPAINMIYFVLLRAPEFPGMPGAPPAVTPKKQRLEAFVQNLRRKVENNVKNGDADAAVLRALEVGMSAGVEVGLGMGGEAMAMEARTALERGDLETETKKKKALGRVVKLLDLADEADVAARRRKSASQGDSMPATAAVDMSGSPSLVQRCWTSCLTFASAVTDVLGGRSSPSDEDRNSSFASSSVDDVDNNNDDKETSASLLIGKGPGLIDDSAIYSPTNTLWNLYSALRCKTRWLACLADEAHAYFRVMAVEKRDPASMFWYAKMLPDNTSARLGGGEGDKDYDDDMRQLLAIDPLVQKEAYLALASSLGDPLVFKANADFHSRMSSMALTRGDKNAEVLHGKMAKDWYDIAGAGQISYMSRWLYD